MPIAKSKRKKYGIIIATQIKNAKKRGLSKAAAKAYGKKKAEQWNRDHKK